MSYIYNLTDTWNAAGTTFASIKMAVTNTASSASSNLLDLSVSGATTASFTVSKFGALSLNGSITSGTQQTAQGSLILANTAAGAFATTVQSSNSASAAWTLTLPATAGTANYALTTNGSGVSSWSQISLTAGVTGTLPLANGGTNNSSAYTAGAIIFSNGTSLTQNTTANQQLFWDNTNTRLGIGTAAPSSAITATSPGDTLLLLESASTGIAAMNMYAASGALAAYNYFASKYGANTAWYVGGNGIVDAVGFTTGATEKIRVNSAGNVQMVGGGLFMPAQAAPTSKGAAATLTGAELITGLLQYTGAADTITLPTGTNIEGALTWSANNVSLNWVVINTGSGVCTIGANGNTTVGTMTVTNGTSGHFLIRRTATNTFTVYRMA